MAQVLSPQMHSSPLLGSNIEASRWGDFDYSMIHPSHGISLDSFDSTGSMSQAEQLLSSLGFDKHAHNINNNNNEEEDLFNLGLAGPSEDSAMLEDDSYQYRQSSSESLVGIVDDNDSAYDSSTSDSSAETVTPSSSMSLVSIHDPALSAFPFPEGAKHVSKKRSHTRREQQENQVKARYSPSIQLERISSCYFNPPTLSSQDVPLDATLEQQYISASSSSSSSYATRPYYASSSSSSSSMQASASSSMIRSYSAPTHTQAEYDLLKDKWNAESAAARSSALASTSSSSSLMHSASTSQLSPTRPGFARRASSAVTSSSTSSYSSGMSLRRTRDYDEASASSPNLSTYNSLASEPYSSRTHLLSPLKRGNPFKRSRLAYVNEEMSGYSNDTAAREQVFGRPSTPTDDASAQGMSKSSSSQITPPKSPNRPSLNRFFTSPEFFVGGGSSGHDSSDDDDGVRQ